MLTWTPEMSIGIQEIDAQHQSFVATLNEMMALFESGNADAVAGPIIDGLCAYAEYHFATEEKYFLMFDYELAAEHIIEHRRMAERLAQFRRAHFERGEHIIGELFVFAADWLTEHLMVQDRKYVECFHEHGLY
ncbi:MAG: bacteriohemerythrin [Patescibacteria group bacterium]|jgi:hemerythrin